jgi:putative DNA-invertase from lambdoid prophage Rac
LVQTLQDLQAWNVSLISQTGLQFDLSTPQGKLIASLMAALAEFERDLLRERIRSGFAAAKAKGRTFGRKPGERTKSSRFAPKVVRLREEGRSYRFIAKELDLSVNTIRGILHRHDAQNKLHVEGVTVPNGI